MIAAIALTGFVSDHIPVRNLALADTRKVVSITADGQNRIVTTDVRTVGEVLSRAGVALGKHDLVEPSVSTALPSGFFNINVYRSQPYNVIDGNTSTITASAQQSPRLIVTDANIKLYPEDNVTIKPVDNFLTDKVVGQKVIIDRAVPVQVMVDGSTRQVRTQATTVLQLLQSQAISLGAKDTITPDLTSGVVPGLTIKVTRVAEVVVTKTETIPFKVKTVDDPSLSKGTSDVQTAGSNGSQQVTYRIHYRDGVEVARETLSVTGHVDPVTQVVVVGTKVIFAGNVEYWRPYVVAAAAQYGVNANLMMAIMSCESGGNAAASNGTHFGLFQYGPDTWRAYGNSMSTIFDGPTQIVTTAGRLSQPNATSPWLASKFCWSGRY